MMTSVADLTAGFQDLVDAVVAELAEAQAEVDVLRAQRDEARLLIDALLERIQGPTTPAFVPTDFGVGVCRHCQSTFARHGPHATVCDPCRSSGAKAAKARPVPVPVLR